MLTPGNAAIVYHAGAGRGLSPAIARQVYRRLKTEGWRITAVEQTRGADHARTALAPRLGARADLMVVVAGDGTLREVGAGLRATASRAALAFIPTGNANVVAREMGIPLDPQAAMALLTHGVVRSMDMGSLRTDQSGREEIPFLAMAEVGFGAVVVQRAQRLRDGWLKPLYRKWGDPIYLVAGLAALLSLEEKLLRIFPDDDAVPIDAFAAIVANTRCYAKGWHLASDARPDDGWLDLVARRQSGPGPALRALRAAAKKRRPPSALCRVSRGRRFVFQSDGPMAVQVDGDPLPGPRWMEARIVPGALRLLVPTAPPGDDRKPDGFQPFFKTDRGTSHG